MGKKHTLVNIYIPKAIESDILKIRQKHDSISSHVLDLVKNDMLKNGVLSKEEHSKIEIPFLIGTTRTKSNIRYPMLKIYVSEENATFLQKAKAYCKKKKIPFSTYICDLLLKNNK